MRLDFLLINPDAGSGVESSTFAQAEMAAVSHDVEIIGVRRTESAPSLRAPQRVKLRYLLEPGTEQGSSQSSQLVPPQWGQGHSAVSDRALYQYFATTTADMVVTSTPALAALAVEFAPSNVRVIYVEHQGSMNRGADLSALLSHGARLDGIVCQTVADAMWLRGQLGDVSPPIAVIPRGLRSGFSPQSTLKNRTIVAGGRLVRENRLGHVVRAFAVANELAPGWRLRVYGDGPMKGDLRYGLWRQGVAGMVDIVPRTSRIAAELSKASIYASASAVGGTPMLGLESAAAGLPMVAYDTAAGLAEHIRATQGGLLVPDDSPVSLGVALAHLMSSPEALREYGEQAKHGANLYRAAALNQRWEEVYGGLSGQSRRLNYLDPPVVADEAEVSDDGVNQEEVDAGRAVEPAVADTDTDEVALKATPKHSWLGNAPTRNLIANPFVGIAAKALVDRLRADAVDSADVDAGRGCPTLAVDESHRGSVVEALESVAAELGLEIVAQRGTSRLHVDQWHSNVDRPVITEYANVFGLVERANQESESPRLIDVELWRQDDAGTRYAPRKNAVAEWMNDAAWERWVSGTASTPSGAHAWNKIDFAIDAVFTWVNGSDPAWNAQREARLQSDSRASKLDESHDAVSSARFISRDEIYYSVSAVKKFLPWIRSIYIVTDGQVHSAVAADFPDVRFVNHREIFPNPAVLPVFNSRAIESCIHRIPGLSEHFIYFNDDVIVARPLEPTVFFQANGVARFFPSDRNINHGANSHAPHLQAGGNNRELMVEAFDFEATNTMLHTPHPHVKSVLLELEERYPEEFAVTRSSAFRSPRDVSLLSSLAQYYGWATQRYAASSLNYRFLRLNGPLLKYRMMRILEDLDIDVVALGEPLPGDQVHADERGIVREFLQTLVGHDSERP